MNKEELIKKLSELTILLDISKKEVRVKEIEGEMNSPEFWLDEPSSTAKIRELKNLKSETDKIEELGELLEIAEGHEIQIIEKDILELDRLTLFSGKYDQNSVILSFFAGAGGDDAQDWTEMLMNMYIKWAENKDFLVTIISKTDGGMAGIKNATLKIDGHYAYGMLRRENGVHRLVRQSPFNAKDLRQTSFSLVEVMPEMEQFNADFVIPDKDLRVDTFRSSGNGGQSVNTTDSAVRITHVPTGIMVSCQNEKSQLQNKTLAMSVLRARLAKLMLEQHQEKLEDIRGESSEPEWGSQIRSYVLHPYKMVKDHRTGHESKNPDDVLAGDIDAFIDAELRGQNQEFRIKN